MVNESGASRLSHGHASQQLAMMRGRLEKLTKMRSETGAVRNSMDTKIVSRIWWSLVLRGGLAILFGIVALFYTGQTLLALVFVFGFFALLNGIMLIVAAVRAGEGHLRWGLLAFSGIIGVAAGIVSFVWPGLTALAIVFIVAAWAIITGITRIVAAIQLRRVLQNEWLLVGSGVASVIFGAIAALFPGAGILAIIWLLGAWLIVLGVLLIALAFSLRQLAHGLSTAGVH